MKKTTDNIKKWLKLHYEKEKKENGNTYGNTALLVDLGEIEYS